MLFFLLFVVAVLVLAWVVRQQRLEGAWKATAAQLGIPFARGSVWAKKHRMAGRVHGFPLVIEAETFGKGDANATRFVLDGKQRLPKTLEIWAENRWERVKKVFVGEDILTGDDAFDAVAHVRGREEHARAALSHAARQEVMAWVRVGGKIADGQLTFQRRGVMSDVSEMVTIAKMMAATAEQLAMPVKDAARALAEHAKCDPLPSVRLVCLRTLATHFPEANTTRTAAQAATQDADPELRLSGARLLGDAGLDALTQIARDVGVDAAYRAEAIGVFAQTARAKAVVELVGPLMEDDASAVRVAAVHAAGHVRAHSLLERLCAVVERGGVAEQAAAAEVLGALGDARAETPLIGLLAVRDAQAQTAAARALQVVGTVRAVEALVGLTTGLMVDAKLKQAARAAVEAIQRGLGEVEAGRLSVVAEVGAGGLSIVDEARSGGLSASPTSAVVGDVESDGDLGVLFEGQRRG